MLNKGVACYTKQLNLRGRKEAFIMVNEALRERIDKYIKENKLSKKQMADNLRIHRSSFSQYMNNPENLSSKTIDTIETSIY